MIVFEIKQFCDEFDEGIRSFKVHTGRGMSMDLWVDRYKPHSLEEQAVHKRKVEEVKTLFEERFIALEGSLCNYVILFARPAGVRKSGNVGLSLVEAMLSEQAQVFYGDIRSHEKVPILNDDFAEKVQLKCLKDDIEAPSFLATKTLESVNLWMNSSQSRSSTHYDPHNNLLCIVSRSKKELFKKKYWKLRSFVLGERFSIPHPESSSAILGC